MKNHYQELRDRQQEEVNAFPMFFAFDQRQFAEGMRRLGLRPSDMNQVYAIAGTGGFTAKAMRRSYMKCLPGTARSLRRPLPLIKLETISFMKCS